MFFSYSHSKFVGKPYVQKWDILDIWFSTDSTDFSGFWQIFLSNWVFFNLTSIRDDQVNHTRKQVFINILFHVIPSHFLQKFAENNMSKKEIILDICFSFYSADSPDSAYSMDSAEIDRFLVDFGTFWWILVDFPMKLFLLT